MLVPPVLHSIFSKRLDKTLDKRLETSTGVDVMTRMVPAQTAPTGRRQKNFRLPADLIDRIEAHADRQGMSDNTAATSLLTEAVTLAELRAGIGVVAEMFGSAAARAMRDLVSAVEEADAAGELVPPGVRRLVDEHGEKTTTTPDRQTTTESYPASSRAVDRETAEG